MRQHLTVAVFGLAIALPISFAQCDEPSSIGDRVQAAERDAQSAIDTARNEIVKLLETKRTAAQNKGDLAEYERLTTELDAFKIRNAIPKSVSTRAYERTSKKTLADLERVYEQAVSEYTKAGNIEDARAIQERLDGLKTKQLGRPLDAVRFKGHYYKLFPDMLTWYEARTRCEQMGGRLVIVNSPDVNSLVARLALDSKVDGVWLGATDRVQEGSWKWVDGQPMKFTFWDAGQPNNFKEVEHYSVLLVKRGGKWWDYPMDPTAHPDLTPHGHPGFICEWE